MCFTFQNQCHCLEGTTTLTVYMDVPFMRKQAPRMPSRVERQHVFFDTASGGLMVGEIYILSNLGDRTITGSSGDDAPISPLQFSLPENAASVTFEEGKRPFSAYAGWICRYRPAAPWRGQWAKLLCVMCCPEDGMSYAVTPSWPTKVINFLVPRGWPHDFR